MQEVLGKEVLGYKLTKLLGEGKFSHVYKGVNQQGNTVAVKKLKIFEDIKEKDRERCLREVELMKKVEHPHIIQLIDTAIIENELFILLEWAEKGDLKNLIKEAKEKDLSFSEENIWEFMIHIASGIEHMHKNRIMHRDLKPANILIDHNGNLKLADLGLGRIVGSQTLEVYSKVGTPLYMSPELLKGEGYDMKSDIWSIGCILYELCGALLIAGSIYISKIAELKSPFRNDGEKINLKELHDRIIGGRFAKMNTKKYSQTLKDTIYSMINMDVSQRIDAETIVTIARRELDKLKNMLKIDKSFVMEDIYYKLSLLQYEQLFCKPLSLRRISPIFFINEEEEYNRTDKFEYFFLLAEWILKCLANSEVMPRTAANRAGSEYDGKRGKKDNAKTLLQMLKNSGIKFSVLFSLGNILNGYGDEVCYILNDLTTEILIRQNYEFKPPTVIADTQAAGYVVRLEDEDAIDDQVGGLANHTEGELQGGVDEEGDFLHQSLVLDRERRFVEDMIVNPQEWNEELRMVGKEIQEFQEIIDSDPGATTIAGSDYSCKLMKLKILSEDIHSKLKSGILAPVEERAFKTSDELEAIRSKEETLLRFNLESVQLLSDYQEKYQLLDSQILRLTLGNKKKLEEYTKLKSQSRDLAEQLKHRQIEATDSSRLYQIKDSIKSLKTQIKELHVKAQITGSKILRAVVTDIYKKENKENQVRWSDLEMSVANLNNSMILHRSTMAKKEEEKLRVLERQQQMVQEQVSKARRVQQPGFGEKSGNRNETVLEVRQEEEEGRAYSADNSFEEL